MYILGDVYEYPNCGYSGCSDKSWAGSGFCKKHHPSPENHRRAVIEELSSGKRSYEGRDWSHLDLSGIDLSGKDFHYCRFSGAVLKGAIFNGAAFLMCFLDDTDASDCRFEHIRMMNGLAAGADFSRSSFIGSDIINTNFIGISAIKAIFDESDLFYSRFIGANLQESSFRDCNLKRVDFTESLLRGVAFNDSNPEEAYIPRADFS